MRILNWGIAAGALVAASLCVGALEWTFRGVVRREHVRETAEAKRYAELGQSIIVREFKRLQTTAQALGASSQFSVASDAQGDDLRFREISSRRALTLADRELIQSWLPLDRSSRPISTIEGRRTQIWQIFRGLPIRAADGRALAQGRRALASSVMDKDPDLSMVAEFDEGGRLVFLLPYRAQLSATRTTYDGPRNTSLLLTVDNLLGLDGGQRLGVVARFNRGGRLGFIYVGGSAELRTDFKDVQLSLVTPTGAVVLSNRLHDQKAHDIVWRSHREPLNIGLQTPLILQVAIPADTAAASRGQFAVAFSVPAALLVFVALIIARLVASEHEQRLQLLGSRKNVELKARGLAHDYRNSILALRTHLANTSSDLTLEEAQRLQGVINDLNGYTDHLSKELAAEAIPIRDVLGRAEPSRTPSATYVRGIVETVAKQQEAVLRKARIPVHLDAPARTSEPFAAIEPADLTRIVSNLLVNAIEACADVTSPIIEARIRATETWVQVVVADNGRGIAPADASRIFDPEFTTKGHGHGRGLSHSRELAQACGGDLRVLESTRGAGTQLELALPRCTTPVWFCNSVPLTSKSVLVVVDDEEQVFDRWEMAISGRFHGMSIPFEHMPRLISLSSPDQLRGNHDQALDTGTVFLIDQEFKGSDTNGVALIRELDLEKKAILVTNHFEQTEVLDAAIKFGFRILPKTYMLNTKFPIEIGVEE